MKKLFFACLTTVLVTACNKNNNNDPIANVDQAAKDRDLQSKNFSSDCQLSAQGILGDIFTGGNVPLKSFIEIYRFDGATVTHTTRYFNSVNCNGENALIFMEKGDVNIHPDQRTSDQGKAIDINYKNLAVTTVNSDGVTAANTLKLCSAGDWSPHSTRDETAHSAEKFCYNQALPLQIFTVYRVDAKVLYLVQAPKASATAAGRPASALAGDKFTTP